MRFGFVSCVRLGLSCMETIYDSGGRLELAITLDDDMGRGKSGRIFLDQFCDHHDLDLLKIRNINDAKVIEAINDYNLDWLFIIGWSQIASSEILKVPSRGAIGMHPTLLPIGRGRAAVPWAILKGLDQTGVTMFKLDEGVDSGPIIAQQTIDLTPTIDAGQLYHAVDLAHIRLMRDIFPQLEADVLEPRPQDDTLATIWPGRTPEDGRIDLMGSVLDAERLVRAVTRPYPGAFVDTEGGRLIIWRAQVVSDRSGSKKEGPLLKFRDGNLEALEWEVSPN